MLAQPSETLEIIESGHREDRSVLTIGLGVTLQRLYQLPECPILLQKSLAQTTTWPQRNQITVEQTIRSPHIAPLWLGTLMVLGARLTASNANKEFSLDEFLASQNKHSLEISSLWLPLIMPDCGWGLAQVARTPADVPIVAAIALLDLHAGIVRQARLALTGVWPEPVRLAKAAQVLINGPVTREQLQTVSVAVIDEVSPVSDYLGTAEYRREMAGILTQRALESCLEEVDQS
jgi:CO/xanthine dehydrogenase FAD-binding subunit